MNKPLIQIENAKKIYESKDIKGKKYQHVALNDINLTIFEGETLGLVGESGSGKSTLGKIILGFETLTSGSVNKSADTTMQVIFQDPYSSLNPKLSALELVKEAIWFEKDKQKVTQTAREILALVGIEGDAVHKVPKHFSGGQRQRIGIARAIVGNPKFIVCDEPTSALDVSIQAQILQLLEAIKQQLQLSYLFITHDLSVVRHISDRIAVLYQGNLVELATTQQLFDNPQHDYTKKLLSASLINHPTVARKQLLDFAATAHTDVVLSDTFEWVEVEEGHFVRRDT